MVKFWIVYPLWALGSKYNNKTQGNEKLFLATLFEFVYIMTALAFNTWKKLNSLMLKEQRENATS